MACFFLAVSNASLFVDLLNFGPSTVLRHTKICFTVYWPIFMSTLCIMRDDLKYFLQLYLHFHLSIGENNCSGSAISMFVITPLKL